MIYSVDHLPFGPLEEDCTYLHISRSCRFSFASIVAASAGCIGLVKAAAAGENTSFLDSFFTIPM